MILRNIDCICFNIQIHINILSSNTQIFWYLDDGAFQGCSWNISKRRDLTCGLCRRLYCRSIITKVVFHAQSNLVGCLHNLVSSLTFNCYSIVFTNFDWSFQFKMMVLTTDKKVQSSKLCFEHKSHSRKISFSNSRASTKRSSDTKISL